MSPGFLVKCCVGLFQVINWNTSLQIPSEARLSHPACELIYSLCCGSEERLGRNGAAGVKQHPFFQNIEFDGLRKQPAPYIPKIRYATDTSNFDPVDEKDDEEGEIKRDGTLRNGQHPEHAFFEFTFRRFFDDFGNAYATKMKDPETNEAVYV